MPAASPAKRLRGHYGHSRRAAVEVSAWAEAATEADLTIYPFVGSRRRQVDPVDVVVTATPADDARPLISAINSGNITLALGMVMSGVDVNKAVDCYGRTALQLAAARGVVGLCRSLIDHSAEVNSRTSDGQRSALHLAVSGGHQTVLRLLLEARAYADAVSADGETALSLSVADGNVEAMRKLLEAGARVEVPDSPEEEEELALLAEEEAPPRCSLRPQSQASRRERPLRGAPGEVAVPMAAGGRLAALRKPMLTGSASALLIAVKQNVECELIEELMQAGASVLVMDVELNQPLHFAVQHSNTRVVRLLLEGQADPTCCNKDMRTPLHTAAGVGSERIVRLLLEHRAEVNCEDERGLTPLQHASNPAMQRCLMRMGGKEGAPLAMTWPVSRDAWLVGSAYKAEKLTMTRPDEIRPLLGRPSAAGLSRSSPSLLPSCKQQARSQLCVTPSHLGRAQVSSAPSTLSRRPLARPRRQFL